MSPSRELAAPSWRCRSDPNGRRKRAGIWLIAATAGLVLGSMVPVAPLRLLMATPLALLVPGWAVLLIAFDAAPPPLLPPTALAALLSLATYPLLAIGIDSAGRPLGRRGVLVAVGALVLVALATMLCRALAEALTAALARHTHGPAYGEVHGDARRADGIWRAERRRERAGTATYVIAALAATMLAMAMLRLLPQAQPTAYTALSLGGQWAHLDHVVLETSERITIPLHIANHAGRVEIYRLSLDIDGRAEGSVRTIRLGSEATWDGTVAALAARGGRLHRLRITLGSGTSQQVLTLWVQSAPPPGRQGSGVRRVPSPRAAGRERVGGGIKSGTTGGGGQTPGQDDSPRHARPTGASTGNAARPWPVRGPVRTTRIHIGSPLTHTVAGT